MSPTSGRILLSALFSLAVIIAPAASAFADVSMEVTTTGEVSMGEWLQVTVRVSDDGEPVEGTTVVLTRDADFIGVEAYVELARATTGPDGVAVLSYQQRHEHSGELRLTLEEYPEVETTVNVHIIGQSNQLYRSESGVAVPGLNVLLLVAVIVGVWVAMLVAIVLILRMARMDTSGAPRRGAGGGGRPATPLLFGSLTTVIGLVLLVVLARNPTTHANLEGPDGHDRTPHAHIGESSPYQGFGIADPMAATDDPGGAGRAAYIGYGCVACHGLKGAGAVVGGDLGSATRDDLESFIRDVRKGPEVMPEYDESVLDDDTLALIHTYLDDVAGS